MEPTPSLNLPALVKVDWSTIDTVLLDMDGTLLDLAYDNWFWRHFLPQRYADHHQITIDEALARLLPHFEGLAHTLPWYCTRHWSALTGLDIAALKQETQARIALLDGTVEFLTAVRDSGRTLWLCTNAHADSWQVKLQKTGIGHFFARIVSSHDIGYPKEQQAFWQGLQALHPFAPDRAMFADDSIPVLHAAETYGIGQVVAMNAPDTRESSPRPMPGFARSVSRLTELMPVA